MMGVWEGMMMGFAPSPYMVTTDLLEVKCLIRGDQHDLQNTFQWYRVVLNLPGMKDYQQSHPWVYTLRLDTRLANGLFFYIDDGRSTSFSGKEGLRTFHPIGRILSFLRIQEANRK